METGPSVDCTQRTVPSTQAKAAGGRYFSDSSHTIREQMLVLEVTVMSGSGSSNSETELAFP